MRGEEADPFASPSRIDLNIRMKKRPRMLRHRQRGDAQAPPRKPSDRFNLFIQPPEIAAIVASKNRTAQLTSADICLAV
jgi:hypothetical protein